MIKVRKGQAPPSLSRAEFGDRFRATYFDPAIRVEQDGLRMRPCKARVSMAILLCGLAAPSSSNHAASAGLAAPRPK